MSVDVSTLSGADHTIESVSSDKHTSITVGGHDDDGNIVNAIPTIEVIKRMYQYSIIDLDVATLKNKVFELKEFKTRAIEDQVRAERKVDVEIENTPAKLIDRLCEPWCIEQNTTPKRKT